MLTSGAAPGRATASGVEVAEPIVAVTPHQDDARASHAGLGLASLADGLLVVWIAGALLLLSRRLGAELRMRGIRRRAWQPDSRLRDLLHEATATPGPGRTVTLRISDAIDTPAVAGHLRPMILLPVRAGEWSAADLAAVYRHELGHVLRGDGLTNFIVDCVAALYWCNPLVRAAARRMRSESERACDDLVLSRGTEPEHYAQLLLRVASGTRREVPVAAQAMARARELEGRLLAILDEGLLRGSPSRRQTALFAGLGLAFTLPVAALSTTPQDVRQLAPEPDRQADALTSPRSERIPVSRGDSLGAAELAAVLAGPDSALARVLYAATTRIPVDSSDLVAERARWALRQARDGQLVAPLLAALEDPDWRIQAYAAWSLGVAGDRRATAPLLPLLAHPIWRLRAMAASALESLGDPRAESAMRTALRDPAWQVRVEAVDYLARLGGRSVRPLLEPLRGDRHLAVRLAAQRALTTP
jgi:beta-lactamase regulating signal transducer with metallopeptidase domain